MWMWIPKSLLAEKKILTPKLSNHDFIVVRIRWQKQNLIKYIKITSNVSTTWKKILNWLTQNK